MESGIGAALMSERGRAVSIVLPEERRMSAMTDRAEIERLLNQTGRTLEGLPEFYPEEQAIKVFNETVKHGGLWENKLLHQSDVIELLVGALRDALDKPMQKPLTLEELRKYVRDKETTVWEERRRPDNFVKTRAGALAILCHYARRKPDGVYTYNVYVRAWRTLPTDAEREAAKWEN